MECRNLEITLVSAENLPNIRSFGQMKVYAMVSLNGKSGTSKKTNVDMIGETNPRWNFLLDYTISEMSVREPGVEVVVKLYCQRTLGDMLIGEVKIPVKSLFDSGHEVGKKMSYAVSGTGDGKLDISYSFGEKVPMPIRTIDWNNAMGMGLMVLVQGALVILTGDISPVIELVCM